MYPGQRRCLLAQSSLVFFLFFNLGCSTLSTNSYHSRLVRVDSLDGKTVGGLSGIHFSKNESDSENLIFYAVTDRGPNGKSKDFTGDGAPDRPFINPQYSPEILKIKYSRAKQSATVIERRRLRKPDGRPVTGIPNVDRLKYANHFDETPVDVSGRPLKYDPWGLDVEGLTVDGDGSFWLCEEYAPSLLKTDPSGKIISRWLPLSLEKLNPDPRGGTRNLPYFLNVRDENRGFEALTKSADGNIIAVLQSPVAALGQKKLVPILEFDPNSNKPIGLYFYPLSREGEKIGDITLLPNGQFAIIEQNGQLGPQAWQMVFQFDFMHADNFINKAMQDNEPLILPNDIAPIRKKELVDLSTVQVSQFEKLEGIASIDGNAFVIVNDNDFNLGNSIDSYLVFVEGL